METQRGQIKKALKGRALDVSPSNMILENIKKKLKGQRSGEQVIWPLFRGSMVFFCFSFINSDFAATFLD
jgi:hypothetical protein